jgi:hypothetical protein
VAHARPADEPPDPHPSGTATPDAGPVPPDWALEQAQNDLFDIDDGAIILARAWEILGEAQQLEDERHDEYDDPDLGGEA